MGKSRDAAERFWEKVDRRGPDECWEWTGSRTRQGYGLFRLHSRQSMQRAHRVAYTLHYQKIPDGLHCLHRCDNPSCCRPDHLWLGTNEENIRDRDMKVRCRAGVSTPCGERHPRAKLTQAQVAEIRQSSDLQSVLAKRYGVAQNTISKIRLGQRWKAAA